MGQELDILLINVGATKKRIYQELSQEYSAIEPPFWAALTAGFLRDRGCNVKILDANAENLTHVETAERVKDMSPRLTNIVVYGQQPAASTQLMSGVSSLCSVIKAYGNPTKILLTGLHPSALPEQTLSEEACDFVGVGEGFQTVLDLSRGVPLKSIKGLWWKEGVKILSNSRPKNIENLTTELGSVAWDLLPMDSYRAHNWQCLGNLDSRKDYASISTSLGCPFRCDFCAISATFGGERIVRSWSPDWVVNQLEILAEDYGVKNVKIIDEMFVLNPSHFLEISNKISERKLNLNLWAYARVDTTKERHLDKLKAAGVNWLCYGFEAGSNKARSDVHKGNFGVEDMISVRESVSQAGINVLGNYMFGLPEEDMGSMESTLKLAKDQLCEFANFYCTMPYPGSELYSRFSSNSEVLPDSWEGYSQHSTECKPLPTKHLSAKQVLAFRDSAFNNYFSYPPYLNLIQKKFGARAKEHIQKMGSISLRRKLLDE